MESENVVVNTDGAGNGAIAREEDPLPPRLKEMRQAYVNLAREEGNGAAFDAALAKLLSLMQDLETPPLVELPVIGHEDDGSLLVLDDKSRRIKVGIYHEFQDALENTNVGDNIWFHPKAHLAVGVTGRRITGLQGTVKKVRGDRALIDVPGMGEFWYDVNGEEMKPGFTVSVLEDKTITEAWEEPSKAEMLERPNVGYEAVGGLDETIESIKKKVELPLKYAEGYEKLGIRPGGGIILHGPPGTGKTLLARSTAAETDATFFNVKISDIMSKWVGQSEANIAALFQKARDNAPSIIYLDEVEVLGRTRSGGEDGGSRAHSSAVSQFLMELDGLESRGQVVVIASTNRVDLVDEALLRPGRFDEAIEVPPPNREAALEICAIHLPEMLPYEEDLTPSELHSEIVDLLFERSEEDGFKPTGAIIEGLATEIKVQSVLRGGNNPRIGRQDVEAAIAAADR